MNVWLDDPYRLGAGRTAGPDIGIPSIVVRLLIFINLYKNVATFTLTFNGNLLHLHRDFYPTWGVLIVDACLRSPVVKCMGAKCTGAAPHILNSELYMLNGYHQTVKQL